MARGAEAKLRRRTQRKKNKEEGLTDIFGPVDDNNDDADESVPVASSKNFEGNVEVDTSDDDDNDNDNTDDVDNLPKQKKKKGRPVTIPPQGGGKKGIKTTPLILLLLMVGTTILPALIYAGDYLSTYLAKNNVIGSIGYRLGIGSVPKKRVISFYEKHAPEKLDDVPKILAKHYGEYPTLIKKLERKYQDYGYFVGWEDDEDPLKIAMEHVKATYDIWIQQYWNKYAPQVLKTAFRNIRYNLTFLLQKFRKVWKKHIWPMLEPYFGVPDGAAAQKRKDAADYRARKGGGGANKKSGRRKNTDYRDDVED